MDLKLYNAFLFIFTIINVSAEENSTYSATELLSKIFPFGDNQHKVYQSNPVRESNASQDVSSDDSQDIAQDKSRDLPQVEGRGIGRKKRRRQRYPADFGAPYPSPYPYPENGGHFYERPSFASEALSRLTEALTSIALYDDYQCVPRLLCEAGGGALGSASALPTGLQPLLTLLSAYGGISSNPLFVFGRAVLLGVSSKENPSACRYAYPQCPSDPEQLVHYLNNHNGGFFRFFNSPQQGQQNVQQFYNHLQNYQIDQQNTQQFSGDNGQQNQNFGYGLYQQQSYGNEQQNNINSGYGFQNPNPYLNNGNKYGFAYPYNDRLKKGYKIQKRIQNKPNSIENDEFPSNNNGKWSFPDKDDFEESEDDYNTVKDTRESKTLKFPETNTNYVQEYTRKTRGFVFPNNFNYYTNYYGQTTDDNFVNENKVNDYNNNKNKYNYNTEKYITSNKYNNYNKANDGYVTVYVVRGNGDPNKPEIIKLRPGESL
ncbi:unnamed protein product [Colias eurytheme]|nr:unnamed protein product [Colias eurytheme]